MTHALGHGPDPLEFAAGNPFRPVHWRWGRAGTIVAGTGAPLSRRRDDAWVARAVRFRQAIEAAADAADVCLAANAHPAIYWAYEIYRNRDHASRMITAHALEARLLADQPHREIAQRHRIEPGVVEAYAQLFFDVAGKLDATDYIAQSVMGPAVYRGLKERQFDLLWKLYAWQFGPLFLDMFLKTFANTARPSDEAALQAAVIDTARNSMKLKGLLAAKLVSVNDFTGGPLFGEFLKLCEQEAQSGRGGAASESIIENVQALMVALPYRVAHAPSPDPRRPTAAVGAGWDDGAAELRGDELLQLGLGMEIEGGESIRALALPPPRALAEGAAAAAGG